MAQMETDAQGVMARMERGLQAGAQVLADALKNEAASSFKAPTGELAGKVSADRSVKYVGASSRSIEVYARGTYKGRRGRPRRAATVSFVLEYGRGSDMAPNPWNRRASDASSDAVGEAISREMFRK